MNIQTLINRAEREISKQAARSAAITPSVVWQPPKNFIGSPARLFSQLSHTDFQFYAAHNLYIRAKNRQIVALRLNAAQQFVHGKIEKQREKTGKVRTLLLKGRQMGLSTYTGGRFFWKTTQNSGARAWIVTHEASATANLFGMVSRFYKYCPNINKPGVGKDSVKELTFLNLDSGYKVGTAGNRGGIGRSETIQFLHASEFAFWPDAENHLAGVFQAVPGENDTEIIVESTANGVGGAFYDLVMEAKNDKKSPWKLIFVPWFWMPEYAAPVDKDTVKNLTLEEKELKKLYRLSNSKLQWRRNKISEFKSEDLFKQEYPNNVDEAFIYSGRSVFSASMLDAAQNFTKAPLFTGEMSSGELISGDKGPLKIYEYPAPGVRYVIGADVAEGLAHGDYSCAKVLELKSGRLCAEWHGHTASDLFAYTILNIAKYFNRAFILHEANNHGILVSHILRKSHYPRVFARQDEEARSEGRQTKKLGFVTTARTKSMIIDKLSTQLRDYPETLISADTISEMRTFAVEDNGSMNARPGCFDDRVMANALAVHALDVCSWRRY